MPSNESEDFGPTVRDNAEWEVRKALGRYFDPATIEQILVDLRDEQIAELEKWKGAATVVLENIRVNDMPALRAVEIASGGDPDGE